MRAWQAAVAIAVSTGVLACGWLACEAWSLPRAEQIRGELFRHRAPPEHGTWMPLWAIAPTVQRAVVAWEDPAFYFHTGLDYREIGRAIMINARAGRFERGASTITQQVVKNLLLGPDKTLRRKVREAILARRLERVLTKDEILTVYLNIAEWGDGIVGAEAASFRYFGRPAADLDWSEAALLAGILPNPRQWNPCTNPARARQERHAVLIELVETKQLQSEQFAAADAAPVGCPADQRAVKLAQRAGRGVQWFPTRER